MVFVQERCIDKTADINKQIKCKGSGLMHPTPTIPTSQSSDDDVCVWHSYLRDVHTGSLLNISRMCNFDRSSATVNTASADMVALYLHANLMVNRFLSMEACRIFLGRVVYCVLCAYYK